VNQALTLFLYRFPSLIGCSHFSHQAQNFLLGHALSSARGRDLIFQNRDPLGRLTHFTTGGH
jgi:hypothetical protein